MKKIIFGGLLVIVGLSGAAFCIVAAVAEPWNYNGITGLLGGLLGNRMLVPLILNSVVVVIGLVISWYEAYIRK